MKLYKLYTHTKSYSDADLVLNPKGHPDAKKGDVVEVFDREDEDNTRLLLQITKFNDLKGRDVISIYSTLAAQFNLRRFTDVVMRPVEVADVALDSIEITFKDQYMGRSEMWRLKSYLTNTCVYLGKKIDYNDMQMRCQVYEMWSLGDRVRCGIITEDTKIVFRSSTSMVYLFLQMSSEMWEYDIYGDLYYEKAVNGFLTELFQKWKMLLCNHEVTIVLFSRIFYDAKSLQEFPEHMRDCLQLDYKGRFYEDFYRVVIQNERNDDWCTILPQLRTLCTSYQSTVPKYHERKNLNIPAARISTAAQGNFLEVLNVSLNAFEKHYLDRTFDRTGQFSVVITPGVGVFEVDRELANITKQRIIDNGVGSDLVCLGEQPWHAVPLLKFHNKEITAADDYSLPHWINLSFYSSDKNIAYSDYRPRIKQPSILANKSKNGRTENEHRPYSLPSQHNAFYDYDKHDNAVFHDQVPTNTCSLHRVVRAKKTSVPSLEISAEQSNNVSLRKLSDPDIHHGTSGMLASLTDSLNFSDSLASDENSRCSIVSVAPIVRPGRSLINPFDPSNVTIKLTSNRRRWTHIFPKGRTGELIQQHHYQAVPNKPRAYCENDHSLDFNSSDYDHKSDCPSFSTHPEMGTNVDFLRKRNNSLLNSSGIASSTSTTGIGVVATSSALVSPAKSFLWGATGEQEWTSALITGVDWKSLTIPACLPITTDYFPDKRSLHNDYVVTSYTLLPDDVNLDYATSRAVYRKPLTTDEVFKEIVSQRLAQGFQFITSEKKSAPPENAPCCGGNLKQQLQKLHMQHQHQRNPSVLSMKPPTELTKEYLLSIGRIFHKVSLTGSVITATGYRPRHPYPPINVAYRYRFHAPQHDNYEIAGVNFKTEKLENFNWNYMDLYICTRGDIDYPLTEGMKYWRYRMYLLPKDNIAVNKIIETGCSRYYDIFTELTLDNSKQRIEDFLRLMELHINKLKRQINRKVRESPTAQQSHLTRRRHSTSIISRPPPNQCLGNSPFRDRVGSNRLPEKRPSFLSRSVMKIDRGRISPAADAAALASTSELTSGRSIHDDQDDSCIADVKFRPNATLMEILDSMKHPVTGVGFFSETPSLPPCTFTSYDALMWLKSRLDNKNNPLVVLESMRKEKMICHASGNWDKPIIPGFFLYYIVQQDTNTKGYVKTLNDLFAFENEWMEIEIQGCSHLWTDDAPSQSIPNFLKDVLTPLSCADYSKNNTTYRRSHLEIDVNQKSNRMEWGHVKYHTVMQPGNAFEIVVEWVTSSGPIVWDLIYGWTRKANQCGYQLVPVPCDPMAGPFTEKADPLRGPIFIPLAEDFLQQDSKILFEEFPEESRSDRMLLFQEAILARFGFYPCVLEKTFSKNDSPKEYQFVHCTGNVFVLIRCLKEAQKIQASSSDNQEANITRCVYGHTNNTNVPKKVGFLWAWNHMIPNKKWKALTINSSSENELFQLYLLKDFRDFCSNNEQRLTKFWEYSQEIKRQTIKMDKALEMLTNTK